MATMERPTSPPGPPSLSRPPWRGPHPPPAAPSPSQILTIQAALAAGERFFMFEGRNIAVHKGLALFITMNPTYEFRNVLPSNLKVSRPAFGGGGGGPSRPLPGMSSTHTSAPLPAPPGPVPPGGHDGSRLPLDRRGVAVRQRVPERSLSGYQSGLSAQGEGGSCWLIS